MDDASLPCLAIASEVCELLGAVVIPLASGNGYDGSVVVSYGAAGDVVHVAMIVGRKFGDPVLEVFQDESVYVKSSRLDSRLAQQRDEVRRGVPRVIDPGRLRETEPLHARADLTDDDNLHSLGIRCRWKEIQGK